MKDEGPYLLEWIAYHRALGVSQFLIADNNSTDGTGDLLRALQSTGFVELLDYPETPGVPPQLPAYSELMERFGSEADWIAFIDADEFLLPDDVAPMN
ncbi:glycosyltransferase family 2 protein [uncultured Nitratireductor sp.]|uniref:glycosyltransferase family 2 protein n=1 Tax=uncultured Nitratireductor sp. TaxID=520953 RepID=UPI003451CE03